MNNKWLLPLLFAAMLAIAWFTSSTTLEIVATTTGLLSVWLTARQNIWAWPVGLVNVGCFFFMFLEVKLYADMMLQVVFFVLSIYGWIVWLTKREGAKVRPTRNLTKPLAILLGMLAVAVTALWGYLLHAHTDASIPYADAFIATLSLIAQFLLSSKILQNWLVWIAVDVLSVGMYFYKELYALAFLYVIFLGIATSGYVSWKRDYDRAAKGGTTHG
ncbi:nicotinamide riboside transporter PnuC [Paenibacillus agaridevorans]|uniref:nicotinamide riboside transporter PnuC n=1 Tax=Paenibacillus agaridevorans TaxID=171404 RepID=UPI001BE48F06|nr:nicotinamide riboside transporter PnuC [Paenibacillus agaridevorans]